ncbi:mitochondrial inner membrane protease ATP23 homolog [Gordionus sp. m RMFG-2023]|uniref:mitochondrial inner membrane protease ATP23 homolog n=1 Tax=Gordionus sp. m RMFG-2023 TaxID=3053472 RepID=UPI0031FCF654
MTKAMSALGCDFDPKRHVSCEKCSKIVAGGYDPSTNQIVMCQENAMDTRFCEGTMAHEMVHMFDLCRNKMDFSNINHLACTEIRAYNLTPCLFSGFFWRNPNIAIPVKHTHKQCVRYKAAASIAMSRTNITMDQALEIVDKVFDKCYADLEPLGYIPAIGNYEKAKRLYRTYENQNPYELGAV